MHNTLNIRYRSPIVNSGAACASSHTEKHAKTTTFQPLNRPNIKLRIAKSLHKALGPFRDRTKFDFRHVIVALDR